MSCNLDDTLFCSGDATAIQALAMIGFSDLGISFEILLKKTGLQKNLRKHFLKKFFKENINIGAQNLITGQGLK
jgi:homoserine trans-succinylase